MPSLSYKLGMGLRFVGHYGNLRGNKRESAACFSSPCSVCLLSVNLEAGSGLGKGKAHTRPADILVSNPSGSASAAYDITVTSPLNYFSFPLHQNI